MFPRTRMLYSGWLKLLRTSPVLIYWSSVKCLSGQSPKDAKNTTPTPDADWQKIQKCLLRHRQTRGQLLSSGQETPVSLCILSCTWLICEKPSLEMFQITHISHRIAPEVPHPAASHSCFKVQKVQAVFSQSHWWQTPWQCSSYHLIWTDF